MTNSVKTVGINRGNEVVLRDGGETTEAIEDNNKIAGLAIGGVFQRQDLATETNLSDEMNHLGETTDSVSSVEPLDKKVIFRGTAGIVSYVEILNT